ncbi:MAG TPA: triose-phosphate isomerase [bacterium]|nr:triose-phosphate isomerase [bacterium]
MTRRPILAGNWKMYLSTAPARELAAALAKSVGDVTDVDVVLIPSFTVLGEVRDAIAGTNIGLGAQNCHFEEKGAFTGEVAPQMLVDAGCAYVVIGHSERRHIFGETSELCNKKIVAALNAGLTPIYCIGELLEEREAGRTFAVLEDQLNEGLAGLSLEQAQKLVIAYEPVWAIGTGKTATPQQAQEVHEMVRNWLSERFDAATANGLRIQYGGSVKPDNVDELMACPDIDGALVGGASLKADSFTRIVRFEK